METFFNIRYEFDREAVLHRIQEAVDCGSPSYVCVADGNILALVHRDPVYRQTVAESLFSICDSSWVPVFLRWLYGIDRSPYCGAQIFQDLVSSRRFSMAFVGAQADVLADLRANIAAWNPGVVDMPFIELPFRRVEDFDYPAIARQLDATQPDLVWVALGAPKQERFMQRLRPHLHRGVMIGVGAVFNFYSAHVRRAPAWLRSLRLEFLGRIVAEPRKQLARCAVILSSLPAIVREEQRRKTSIQRCN